MDVLKACVRVPAMSCTACDGSQHMFVCWFGVDVIVEFKILCDFCEKPSIGCRILRDFCIGSMG